MDSTITALTLLFNRIPRRHSVENVKEMNGILSEYEDILKKVEAISAFYEKNTGVFFDELDNIRSVIKKSTDNKASKKMKDAFFDEASGALKDGVQRLMGVCTEGGNTA